MTAFGTFRTSHDVCCPVANGGKAEVAYGENDVPDPLRKSRYWRKVEAHYFKYIDWENLMSRSDLIPFGALLLRLGLGVLFLAHGLLKLLVHKPSGTAAYFRSLGLPGFVGYLTMAAEIGGGTLLIVGVATSLVALALVPLMLGTIFMVHGSKGWLFTNEGGGWEFPAFWILVLIVQSMIGSGAYSIGHALGIVWR
jgi:putative oxidoreductase